MEMLDRRILWSLKCAWSFKKRFGARRFDWSRDRTRMNYSRQLDHMPQVFIWIIPVFLVSEYKKKLYTFQEDAEQLEGFQTQEMAKIKHLVSIPLYYLSASVLMRE